MPPEDPNLLDDWAELQDLQNFAPSTPQLGERVHRIDGIGYTDTDLARELLRSRLSIEIAMSNGLARIDDRAARRLRELIIREQTQKATSEADLAALLRVPLGTIARWRAGDSSPAPEAFAPIFNTLVNALLTQSTVSSAAPGSGNPLQRD